MLVAERGLGRFEPRILLQQVLGDLQALARTGSHAGGDVAVVDVVHVAVRDEQVLPAVEVDIHEDRRPRPAGRRDAGEAGDLCVGAVAAVPVERVARELLAGGGKAGRADDRRDGAGRAEVLAEVAVEHLDREEIQPAVAVDVGEIHAHRGEAHVAQRHRGRLAEAALPVAEPQMVRRLEIVAHIDVGKAVAVHVADLDREPEIRGGRDRTPFRVAERLLPRRRREPALAVVEIQHVGLAELVELALDDPQAVGETAGDDRLAVHHAGRDRRAVAEDRLGREVALVEVQVAVAVDVREGQRGPAGAAGDPAGRGDIGETALAVVQQARVRPAEPGDEQVRRAVPVEIAEHRADGGLVGAAGAGARGHVGKLPSAEVAEELVGGLLVDEIQVHMAVAIDVRGGDARAVHQVLELPEARLGEVVGEIDAQCRGIEEREPGLAARGHGQLGRAVTRARMPVEGVRGRAEDQHRQERRGACVAHVGNGRSEPLVSVRRQLLSGSLDSHGMAEEKACRSDCAPLSPSAQREAHVAELADALDSGSSE